MRTVTVTLTCDACDEAVTVYATGCVLVADPVTDEYRVWARCPSCGQHTEAHPDLAQSDAILAGGATLAVPEPRT